MQALSRQTIPVRVRQLETPGSYLRRLCIANSIDATWLVDSLRRRRRADGRDTRDLGVAIAELGGPTPEHFEAAHAAALVGHANLRGPWARQEVTRTACLSCTAGERVQTYSHVRFAFCRRHRQWLGVTQRHRVMDEDLWKAERRLRHLVTRGRVSSTLYESTWGLVRDNAYMTEGKKWSPRLLAAWDSPDFVLGTDDRVALFAETVRVLDVASQQPYLHRAASGREGRAANRNALNDALAWVVPDRWLLVEGMVSLLETELHRARA